MAERLLHGHAPHSGINLSPALQSPWGPGFVPMGYKPLLSQPGGTQVPRQSRGQPEHPFQGTQKCLVSGTCRVSFCRREVRATSLLLGCHSTSVHSHADITTPGCGVQTAHPRGDMAHWKNLQLHCLLGQKSTLLQCLQLPCPPHSTGRLQAEYA